MKVTVTLEMSDPEWGYITDLAARAGLSVEDYIATAAVMGDPDQVRGARV